MTVYLTQPFFQDGVIARAANDVAEHRGIPYFSSAGNNGRDSWEGSFRRSGVMDPNGCEYHSFGNGKTKQRIRVSGEGALTFQWEDAAFSVSGGDGATTDLDLWVFRTDGSVYRSDTSNDLGADPIAYVSGFQGTVDLAFSLCSGRPPPTMKWISFASLRSVQYNTRSSTSFGHPNAKFVAGVGAAHFLKSPAYGVSPAELEDFSSRGGTPIFYDRAGNAQNPPEIRMQPRFVAADGIKNTFFGRRGDHGSGDGRYFFGTFATWILR